MKTYHVLLNLVNPLRSNHHRVDEAVLGLTVQAHTAEAARVTAKLQVYMLGDHRWNVSHVEEETF